MRFTFFILLFLFYVTSLSSQEAQYKVAGIGFYNFENLFDTIDDPNKRDSEFTPGGRRKWTQAVYEDKLNNLAKVVSELGTEITPDGLALLGVSEIENRQVLE
ncbi:MAG TPA: endonuclease/exonuclease/phosphatase family protein, partial [Bacteroidetes bacterium]|nr:endonuclease/exonuclease/phosphatase family protein [Bacteroidota bacterium]